MCFNGIPYAHTVGDDDGGGAYKYINIISRIYDSGTKSTVSAAYRRRDRALPI